MYIYKYIIFKTLSVFQDEHCGAPQSTHPPTIPEENLKWTGNISEISETLTRRRRLEKEEEKTTNRHMDMNDGAMTC